ncbi:13676_t:CDS:1, partial [Racocetra fulgida]
DLLLLKIINLIENASDHPLSKALTQYVNQTLLKDVPITTHITLDSVEEIIGRGLKSQITIHSTELLTYEVFIGNERWLKESGCIYPPYVIQEQANETLLKWKELGYSIVLVGLLERNFSDKNQKEAVDPGYILAQFGIADTPRPDAEKTVNI